MEGRDESTAATDREIAAEKARDIAWRAYIDGMHFHEVAIADPFEAERQYQGLAKAITDALGTPAYIRRIV